MVGTSEEPITLPAASNGDALNHHFCSFGVSEMIYVRLAGGLGNQLFQIAAAMVADPTGVTPVVPLTGALARYATTRQPDSLRLLATSLQFQTPTSRTARAWEWLAVACRAGKWLPGVRLNDDDFQRGLSTHGHRQVAIVDGYFQRGWNDATLARATLRMPTSPPRLAAASRIEPDECVVHVRGGDFLQLPAYQVAGFAYYTAAIRAAQSAGYLRFAVLTDDPEHAERLRARMNDCLPEIFIRVIAPSTDPLVDFDTLRCAAARVIGNSTFAWWAAALDSNQAKTWSATAFTRDEKRDYYLPWEIPIQAELPAVEHFSQARDRVAIICDADNGAQFR